MNAELYEDILENHLYPYARENFEDSWIFQHDNDPKHTAGRIKSWLQRKEVHVLEWPSQSPDLNPIEHLWEELKRRLKG